MPVCLTFDIEEHHWIEAAAGFTCPPESQAEYARRMEASTRWLLEVLAEHGARSTFFVVGQIATTHPQLVRDIAQAGHEVASHSWDHQRIHRLTPDEFRLDVRRVKSALEQTCGQSVVGYRAPTFSITRETGWAIDVLAEEGMRYDSSIFPVHHDRYGIQAAPRVPFLAQGIKQSLLEFPPVTYSVFGKNLPAAGGGYFRLYPPAIIRAGIRQLLRNPSGLPVLYFHPWEFDPDQPRLPLSRTSRFRTYVGMKRTRSRLRDLLARYNSIPIIEMLEPSVANDLPSFNVND